MKIVGMKIGHHVIRFSKLFSDKGIWKCSEITSTGKNDLFTKETDSIHPELFNYTIRSLYLQGIEVPKAE